MQQKGLLLPWLTDGKVLIRIRYPLNVAATRFGGKTSTGTHLKPTGEGILNGSPQRFSDN
ncbi:uncharacterized protein LOC144170790 [Haemaphysalis longicornis]